MFSPNGPWATVAGECTYQTAEIITFAGSEVELGTASNSEETPKFVPGVIGKYPAKGLRWSFTDNRNVLGLRQRDVTRIFTYQANPRVTHDDWAISPFLAQITGQPTVIPPCRVLTMGFAPQFRSVTLRPVFHVTLYRRDISGRINEDMSQTNVRDFQSWRGWGNDHWQEIFSSKYSLQGIAEVTKEDSELEETVSGIVNYYYERLPQCP
jgi:hypothetical protein